MAFLFDSAPPPHIHLSPAKPIPPKEALAHIRIYLSQTATNAHLHPDCRFNEKGPTLEGRPPGGGIILHQLERVAKGLAGERLVPEDPKDVESAEAGPSEGFADWVGGTGAPGTGGNEEQAVAGAHEEVNRIISSFEAEQASGTYEEQMRAQGERGTIEGEVGTPHNVVGDMDDGPPAVEETSESVLVNGDSHETKKRKRSSQDDEEEDATQSATEEINGDSQSKVKKRKRDADEKEQDDLDERKREKKRRKEERKRDAEEAAEDVEERRQREKRARKDERRRRRAERDRTEAEADELVLEAEKKVNGESSQVNGHVEQSPVLNGDSQWSQKSDKEVRREERRKKKARRKNDELNSSLDRDMLVNGDSTTKSEKKRKKHRPIKQESSGSDG